jgi:hypothetical protein
MIRPLALEANTFDCCLDTFTCVWGSSSDINKEKQDAVSAETLLLPQASKCAALPTTYLAKHTECACAHIERAMHARAHARAPFV